MSFRSKKYEYNTGVWEVKNPPQMILMLRNKEQMANLSLTSAYNLHSNHFASFYISKENRIINNKKSYYLIYHSSRYYFSYFGSASKNFYFNLWIWKDNSGEVNSDYHMFANQTSVTRNKILDMKIY